eukprot:TRINITY_DN5188_c0_g2_i2.p1 TRINITY_DN5188_c0_g2~~TRINITY_DN5188_c0_g2_i2.p1  ORF type:complete len:430 (-),score=38.87 TRINITY_DN5188_c0_g2_i2:239-1414(-)
MAVAGLEVLRNFSSGTSVKQGNAFEVWMVLLIGWLVVLICGYFNTFPVHIVGRINVVLACIQVVGTIILCIALPLIAVKRQPLEWVFTNFDAKLKLFHLPSTAYSHFVSLCFPIFTLGFGYDYISHMAEETRASDRTVPVATIACYVIMTTLNWLYAFVLLFCIQDIRSLGSPHTITHYVQGLIMWQVFYSRYKNSTGAYIVITFCAICDIASVFAIIVGASRLVYSLSRDCGLPFHDVWKRLNSSRTPVNAVWLCTAVASVLFPLYLIPQVRSTTTLTTISLSVILWVTGLLIPLVLLIRLGTGFKPGPFNIARAIGGTGRTFVHCTSVLWLVLCIVVFLLPITFPVTEANFNYGPVGALLLIAIFMLWWILDAHWWFSGPIGGIVLGFV